LSFHGGKGTDPNHEHLNSILKTKHNQREDEEIAYN
jgi:hypothetical protein